MHYKVRAKLIKNNSKEFLKKLTDGTISSQKPDGKEIISSMKRARLAKDGWVYWSEVCYCPTPLKHERETVYDHFFSEFETEEIDDYVDFDGELLMDIL